MHVSVEHLLEQVHNSIQLESINVFDVVNLISENIKALFKWV